MMRVEMKELCRNLIINIIGRTPSGKRISPNDDEAVRKELDRRMEEKFTIIGALTARVTLANQTTYDAKVIGFDQDKDVAVLQIDAPKDKLRPRPIGVCVEYLYQLVLTTQPIRMSRSASDAIHQAMGQLWDY
nr:protease Do-like 1, chloroplastic [Tanacetum cinerariifolium]